MNVHSRKSISHMFRDIALRLIQKGMLIPLVAVLVYSFGVCGSLSAQEASGPTMGGPLEIKIVGDRLVARVELQTAVWIKDAHVILDYEMPFHMALNYPVIRDLRYGEGETTIKILNENFRLEIPANGVIDERRLGHEPQTTTRVTQRYEEDLDQIDIVAIIGWPVLRDFGVTIDIQDGQMELHPENDLSADEVRASSESFYEGIEVVGGSLFMPVNYNGGQRAFMKIGTDSYHTVLNREILDDREAGVVDQAYFGSDQSLSISEMVALYPQDLYMKWWDTYAEQKEIEKEIRQWLQDQGEIFPEEFAVQQPDQPSSDVLLVAGLNLLSGYRLIWDPHQGFVGISRTVNSNYSDADHQFYMAAAARDSDELFRYLDENREDRNVEEAVQELFDIGLESEAPVEKQMEAIQYGIDFNTDRRKFGYVADFVFQLAQTMELRDQHADLIIDVGNKAMEFVSESANPKLRQRVQMLLGDRYLARNDNQAAWKILMAAAFDGDPELAAFVRYDLGRAYEALGRAERAYVNYDKALSEGLPPEQAQNASDALERLKPRLPPDSDLLREETEEG